MQMLSPTLNYSLTTRLHGGKAACKRSMAQLQQDLLSTRCERKKTASPQPKKGGKITTLGSAFLKAEGKSPNKNRWAHRTPPTHGHPKRGWPSVKTLGCLEAQNFEGKQFSFFGAKKRNFPRSCAGHTSKIGAKSVFPSLSPSGKKKKKRKKELGLVFNLWETHKGTNVGPAKKWLGEVPPFLELHINSDGAGPSTFCRLFVHDGNSLLKNN